MRGRIEMNTLKQFASRISIMVLAVALLGTGALLTGDKNVVEAEKLATVSLTNKATGLTTEASPPSTRSAPASRKNASTVYVTMTDVNTSNTVQNSHLINANKVVITVTESDFNTTTDVDSGATATGGSALAAGGQITVLGSPGDPVIDTDSDGDLSDEFNILVLVNDANGTDENTDANVNWNGTAWDVTATDIDGSGADATNKVGQSTASDNQTFNVVSVANGDSATNTSTAPAVVLYMTSAGANAGAAAANDDIFIGYKSSAVNTFQVKAWSTVQLESNASWISVVETGRNTGVFEAEFVVADTEGINDGAAIATMAPTVNQGATSATGYCGDSSAAAAGGTTAANDGRFDASGGVNADCEWVTLGVEQDRKSTRLNSVTSRSRMPSSA